MKRVLFLAGIPVMAGAQTAPHATFLTAPYGPGGTWNLYQTNNRPLTWARAQAEAASTPDPLGGTGKPGHLVTIGSAPENMFVYQYVEGTYLWTGLTDHEVTGGTEAGSDRKGGWRWVTGEPVTFSAWHGSEPNEFRGKDEDAVAMGRNALWTDWPMGLPGQEMATHPSMTEWDVQSPGPVKGALVIRPILPAKWPVDLSAWTGAAQGKGPWTVYGITDLAAPSLQAVVANLASGLVRAGMVSRMPRLNYRNPASSTPACGWVELAGPPEHPVSEGRCGALHVAKVRLEKPATWSFSLHGDDYFAMRFPGLKWKSVTGLGGIDPLDPATIYSANESPDGNVIGVIDLPAGDHPVEVVLANRGGVTAIQLLAAPGEIKQEGSTDKWRLPGHKASGDIAWPGMDASGWKVTRTEPPAGEPAPVNLVSGFALASKSPGKTTDGVEKINFIDSGAAGDVLFPDPATFPGDRPGGENDFVIKCTGNIVIPRDGIHHFGFHAEDCCAMRIVGQPWKRLVKDMALNAKLEGDTFYAEAPLQAATNAQVVGEVELKKGSYPVEVFYTEVMGPSVLSVFGSPAGYPPRLLAKDGAGVAKDIDGLPLVEPSK